MKILLIPFTLLMFELGLISAHSLSKIQLKDTELKDIYEVNEDKHTSSIRFISPKGEKPTLREIVYYHLIERPYDEEEFHHKTERPETNAHGLQFIDVEQKEPKDHNQQENGEDVVSPAPDEGHEEEYVPKPEVEDQNIPQPEKDVLPEPDVEEPAKLEPEEEYLAVPDGEEPVKPQPEEEYLPELDVREPEWTAKENPSDLTEEEIKRAKELRKQLFDKIKQKYRKPKVLEHPEYVNEPKISREPVVNPEVTEEPKVNQEVEEPVVNPDVFEEPAINPEVTEEPVVNPEIYEEPVVNSGIAEEPGVNQGVTEEPVVNPEVYEEPLVNPEPEISQEPAVNPEVTEEHVVNPEVSEEPVDYPQPEISLEPKLNPDLGYYKEPEVNPEITEEPVVNQEVTEEPVVNPVPEIFQEPEVIPDPGYSKEPVDNQPKIFQEPVISPDVEIPEKVEPVNSNISKVEVPTKEKVPESADLLKDDAVSEARVPQVPEIPQPDVPQEGKNTQGTDTLKNEELPQLNEKEHDPHVVNKELVESALDVADESYGTNPDWTEVTADDIEENKSCFERYLLYDKIKGKYYQKIKAIPCVSAVQTSRKKREAELMEMPEAPKLGDLNFEDLPEYLKIAYGKPEKPVERKSSLLKEIRRRIEAIFSNLKPSYSKVKRDAPRMYGMNLEGDHGYMWNDMAKPGMVVNVGDFENVSEPELKEDQTEGPAYENDIDPAPAPYPEDFSSEYPETTPTSEFPIEEETSVPKFLPDDITPAVDPEIHPEEETTEPPVSDITEAPFLEPTPAPLDEQNIGELTLAEVLKNDQLWQWLEEWTLTYVDLLTQHIKKLVTKQVETEVKSYLESHKEEKKEELNPLVPEIDPNDDDIEVMIDGKPIQVTRASNFAYENSSEPVTEILKRRRPNDKIEAQNIYGNTQGNDKVTNIFVFYNNNNYTNGIISFGADNKLSIEEGKVENLHPKPDVTPEIDNRLPEISEPKPDETTTEIPKHETAASITKVPEAPAVKPDPDIQLIPESDLASEKVPEPIPDVVPEIRPETTSEIPERVTEVIPDHVEVTEAVSDVTEGVLEVTEVVPKVTEVVSEVTKTVPEAKKVVPELTESTTVVTPEISEVTSKDVAEVTEAVPVVTSQVSEAVSESTEATSEASELAPKITEAAVEVSEATSKVVPEVTEAVPVVTETTAKATSEVSEVVPKSTEATSEASEAPKVTEAVAEV